MTSESPARVRDVGSDIGTSVTRYSADCVTNLTRACARQREHRIGISTPASDYSEPRTCPPPAPVPATSAAPADGRQSIMT